ncbi:EAL domain-containing protein [Vibrio sp. SCSIO 43136]|uniref:putative bifunctional diguanylate cyclase/phosphodiesterase n=1 Tax=Vibrio sp. SCSIO 43136 TaxID=2819101 RepID=UPI002075B8D6|nr:EAL domain-containing protein [Vibrio sp. SCSIO 43136]USD66791.1 EAL domain-containing protein [Vibrio sp. SCSIO 43136]
MSEQARVTVHSHQIDKAAIELSHEASRLNLVISDYNQSKSVEALTRWKRTILALEQHYYSLTNNIMLPNLTDTRRFELDIRRINQQFELLQTAYNDEDKKWATINLTTYTQNLVTHVTYISDRSRVMSLERTEALGRASNLIIAFTLAVSLMLLIYLYRILVFPLKTIVRQLKVLNLGRHDCELTKPNVEEWHLLATELDRLNHRLKDTMVSKELLLEEVAMRKEAEQKARILAQKDALTGLPNRRHFQDMLAEILENGSQAFYVLFFDLDHFKDVNDNLGHSTGDLLLVRVSQAMRDHVGEKDMIARLGGDEFAVLQFTNSDSQALRLAQEIQMAICQPMEYEETQLRVGCSIGIARYPDHGKSSKSLISSADTAMYYAKRNPALTGGITIYSDVLGDLSKNHFTLSHSVKKAIAEEQFDVWFQPQVDVNSGKVHGFEALLRWKKPDGTYVGPDKFIPLLEESGDIIHVGKMVFDRAIDLYRQLSLRGLNYTVSVNVSAIQLERPDFVEYLCDRIFNQNMEPANFPLELTETAIIRNEAQIIEHLKQLKREGFQIQLDDFGTGNASLNILKKLPFDVLKIDKSFTQTATSEGADQSIIEAIVTMSKSLNFDVVIEGVETQNHHQLAKSYEISFAQGFYYARPMPQKKLIKWLNNYQPKSDWDPLSGAQSI